MERKTIDLIKFVIITVSTYNVTRIMWAREKGTYVSLWLVYDESAMSHGKFGQILVTFWRGLNWSFQGG